MFATKAVRIKVDFMAQAIFFKSSDHSQLMGRIAFTTKVSYVATQGADIPSSEDDIMVIALNTLLDDLPCNFHLSLCLIMIFPAYIEVAIINTSMDCNIQTSYSLEEVSLQVEAFDCYSKVDLV